MKITNSQKIGLFVIIVLVALFFALNFLKGHDLFKKSNRYYTYLPSVEGMVATSPIYIRGLKVGSIENIRLDPVKDSFLLTFSIKRDYLIPIDSRAEVYSSDLLGGKALRVALGESTIEAKDGDTLRGENVPDMISVLYSYVGPLKARLGETLENLNGTLNAINQTLDSSTRVNLHASVRNLNASLANIQKLSSSLNGMTPDLSASLKNINTISGDLADPNGDLKSAISNINKTADNLSAVKLTETVDNLNALISKLQSPGSTTGRLMNSADLHNSVDSLINDIDTLIKKIKKNPKRYIKVSVF